MWTEGRPHGYPYWLMSAVECDTTARTLHPRMQKGQSQLWRLSASSMYPVHAIPSDDPTERKRNTRPKKQLKRPNQNRN